MKRLFLTLIFSLQYVFGIARTSNNINRGRDIFFGLFALIALIIIFSYLIFDLKRKGPDLHKARKSEIGCLNLGIIILFIIAYSLWKFFN